MGRISTCAAAALFVSVVGLASCRPGRGNDCELQQLAIDAATGDSIAEYDLAVEFYTGKRIARDYGKAAFLWRQAAERGVPNALSNLGFLTYNGYGIRADPAAAVQMWTRVAAEGGIEANYHLGVAAREGKGMARSTAEAYARFRAAELMAERSGEPTDRTIAENARTELRKLKPILRSAERTEGEARARTYAAHARGDTVR